MLKHQIHIPNIFLKCHFSAFIGLIYYLQLLQIRGITNNSDIFQALYTRFNRNIFILKLNCIMKILFYKYETKLIFYYWYAQEIIFSGKY